MKKILIVLFFVVYVVFLWSVYRLPYQFAWEHSMEFANGDAFTARLANQKHLFEDECFADRAEYRVFENREDLFLCKFYTEDEIVNLTDRNIDPKKNMEISIVSSGKVNMLRYIIFSYCNDEDEENDNMIVGWICGSNIGFWGTIVDDDELANDVLKALTFRIDKTSQTNENYFPDIFDDIENGRVNNPLLTKGHG